MAIAVSNQGGNPGPNGVNNSVFNRLDPAKYTSLHEFIDEVNAPDVRDSLVKTFGDQGITGLLKMTGAITSQGSADEVTYWEEARLHQKQKGDVKTTYSANATSFILDGIHSQGGSGYDTDDEDATVKALVARKGDILLVGSDRFYVSAVALDANPSVTGAGEITCTSLLSGGATAGVSADVAVEYAIIGNMFAQGTDQPSRYLESNVVKRTNPYAIVKEVYKVSGSQATNVGYINLGNGDYRWYLKGEMDTRQRFLDKREMTMVLGQKTTNTAVKTTAGIAGTEGYFAAIEDRGMVTTGLIGATATTFEDIDAVVTQMDKNGCPAEYSMYVNTAQSLALDNMLAGAGSGTPGQGFANVNYGAFNNDKDMALNLGFQSFARAGYTFHKHSWKLLNDPTLLAGADYKGVLTPLSKVTDAKSGAKVHALEMNCKSTNGYSREMEHWVTGGGVLGFNQNGKDVAEFNYRSECNLVTRAANQHVLIK